jgi:hypothetical protein
MKLKPGDTVRVIDEPRHSEGPCDSDQHARCVAGEANRWFPTLEPRRIAIGEAQTESQPMRPKTFKNAEEFTHYIEGIAGKPFKAAPSTEGTTAHEYLSGRRDYAKLFTDPDLIAIPDDKHPDGGLLYVFSDYSSVVYKPSTTN